VGGGRSTCMHAQWHAYVRTYTTVHVGDVCPSVSSNPFLDRFVGIRHACMPCDAYRSSCTVTTLPSFCSMLRQQRSTRWHAGTCVRTLCTHIASVDVDLVRRHILLRTIHDTYYRSLRRRTVHDLLLHVITRLGPRLVCKFFQPDE
jgi:hypothetical protein